MNILLSNDDGYHAEGIQTLATRLREAGHCVTVIAPDRNRSAASSCLTLMEPIRVHQLGTFDYSVIAGTPADCVHLALNGLFETSFDLVVSGINHGANLGDDVVYSGTVAAALEGRHLRLPSLAVSLVGKQSEGHLFGNNHFETAAQVVLDVLPKLVDMALPRQILNINVPDLPYSAIKGMLVTRLGQRSPSAEILKSQDPRGSTIYWLGENGSAIDNGEGTDFYALAHDYVSITPIHADMTAHHAIKVLSEML
ncbi:5'/3'-nucleotidase SurE [[Haemophilus] ducreyi]|uniref:5'-nucleotidase SurE n=2 Tax=Haemophilus ducreyi TaxID=730 RepID=SURE_HAEDU|nr:5'/3'-nucleotidase SurE [[Haemophilus] ducreyi]Q7VN28.1 RecName: Full=5'-nucleotidase SurE; AltName: Full=Nucleoside 5'-monophosphate phosphohydrolase [[Haemophilus] ducreyi 35000HP]AAP95668.1 acid phosphatase stationary-phase survival protein [[Haemophilus] ducreyi 35000HP]AKO30733.1 stationary phase survival protein SurE [[Haemophilus] ducreyi]AKO32172.1 stationary phase survival protein SurE [[Haemophilus] ducreyi]AKO33626.1 stationary phase survival protein SurE [[Haemophilus] ducreyi]